MNREWKIERAGLDDAESIAQFQLDMARESEGTELDLSLVRRGVSEGLKDEAKGTYLVARNNEGKAIGSLLVTREWSDWRCSWYLWIQSVYVCPEFRRQGVYRAMYEKVKNMAREEQSTCVRLYVDRTNQRGLSTYQALGMHESHYLLYEEEL